MKSFILASSSPRRKELLQQGQYSFTIQTSQVHEYVDESLKPNQVVEQLAYQKAEDVFSRNQDAVVLGADTIVACDGNILGKPENKEKVREMLRMLSGRKHQVYTGVAIISIDKTTSYHQKTDVHFYELTEAEIEMYIQSGEPFDKAGGYGIQGFGAYLVKEIVGDYFSVVGLPLAKTMRILKTFGIYAQLQE